MPNRIIIGADERCPATGARGVTRRGLVAMPLLAWATGSQAAPAKIDNYGGPDAGAIVFSLATNWAAISVQVDGVDPTGRANFEISQLYARNRNVSGIFAEPSYMKLFHEQGVNISSIKYSGKLQTARVRPGRYAVTKIDTKQSGPFGWASTGLKARSVEFEVRASSVAYLGRLLAVPSILSPAWRVAVLDAREEDLKLAGSQGVDVTNVTFDALQTLIAVSEAPPFLK